MMDDFLVGRSWKQFRSSVDLIQDAKLTNRRVVKVSRYLRDKL